MKEKELLIIAGPCAVESLDQINELAAGIKKLGIEYLRGGAFKPRTSPDSFQGLGEVGLDYLQEAKLKNKVKIVTEILSPEDIKRVAEVADIIQIGARNMHNSDLLIKIAQRAAHKTILLKRGMSATKEELLGAVHYLVKHGHKGEIILCERGIRTFTMNQYDRNTLDVGLVSSLKNERCPYRIVVDPSHSAGKSELVEPFALAGIAAGADGLIIEIKRDGDTPLSDARQAITLKQLKEIITKAKKIRKIIL